MKSYILITKLRTIAFMIIGSPILCSFLSGSAASAGGPDEHLISVGRTINLGADKTDHALVTLNPSTLDEQLHALAIADPQGQKGRYAIGGQALEMASEAMSLIQKEQFDSLTDKHIQRLLICVDACQKLPARPLDDRTVLKLPENKHVKIEGRFFVGGDAQRKQINLRYASSNQEYNLMDAYNAYKQFLAEPNKQF